MKPLSIAIVEDEKEAADRLTSYLFSFAKEEGFEIDLRHYCSATDAAETFKGQFDLFFLDIMMPGITGMEFAHEIRESDPHVVIVFVTSLSQFAIEGYEVGASDYLLKPLAYPEFRIKMKRVFSKIEKQDNDVIKFVGQGGFLVVPISSILYCETSGHSVIYHTKNGEYRKHQPMKEAEESLKDFDFLRINSCYLVAMREVVGMENHFVILQNGERLLISRPRIQIVSNAIRERLKA